ncbi:MAG: hypothetical protein ACUVUP_04570 [Thermaceae bacterium]
MNRWGFSLLEIVLVLFIIGLLLLLTLPRLNPDQAARVPSESAVRARRTPSRDRGAAFGLSKHGRKLFFLASGPRS